MLHGPGKVIGMALVRHPVTRAVGFTGSRAAGRALFDAAAARPDPIPVFAEMSSLNPVFLLPGALRERAAAIAEGLCASVTLGVGQFCTKPGLVFGLRDAGLRSSSRKRWRRALEAVAAGDHAARRNLRILPRGASPGLPGPPAWTCSPARPRRRIRRGRRAKPWCCAPMRRPSGPAPELAEEVFGPFALLIAAGSLG